MAIKHNDWAAGLLGDADVKTRLIEKLEEILQLAKQL